MSSFERFQRDSRARSNSRSKISKKSYEGASSSHNASRQINQYGSLQASLNNLRINPENLQFLVNPQYSSQISTCILSISNFTQYRVHFKIRSPINNFQNYKVNPYEEVIQKGGSINIQITLKRQRQTIDKFINDKFEIDWGAVPQSPTGKYQFTNSKVVYVKIIESNYQSKLRRNPSNKILPPGLSQPIETYQLLPEPQIKIISPSKSKRSRQIFQSKKYKNQNFSQSTIKNQDFNEDVFYNFDSPPINNKPSNQHLQEKLRLQRIQNEQEQIRKRQAQRKEIQVKYENGYHNHNYNPQKQSYQSVGNIVKAPDQQTQHETLLTQYNITIVAIVSLIIGFLLT